MKTKTLTFNAYGMTPAPKGSYRFVRGHAIPMSKREKPWRNLVADNARIAMNREQFTQFAKDVPVSVRITFFMPRPKTVKRHMPTVPPDIDKLCRAVLDALTDAGVWVDDSQVVDLGATKIYASGPHIGAHITVEGLAHEEA